MKFQDVSGGHRGLFVGRLLLANPRLDTAENMAMASAVQWPKNDDRGKV